MRKRIRHMVDIPCEHADSPSVIVPTLWLAKITRVVLFIIGLIVVSIALSPRLAYADNVASGTYDGVDWRLTDAYELIIGNGGEQTLARNTRTFSSYPWYEYASQIVSVRFDGTVHATNSIEQMFLKCPALVSVDFDGFDTSQVTSFYRIFGDPYGGDGCPNLEYVNVSNLDTHNVTLFKWTFYNCPKLNNLDVSNWDVSKGTNWQGTFALCRSLTSLDTSKWEMNRTSNLYFASMFSGCHSLRTIGNARWVVSANNTGVMFADCYSLESIDVSGFDTSHVSDFYGMFRNCRALTSLDLSSFDMTSVAYVDQTSYWGRYTGLGSFVSGCTNLSSITFGSSARFANGIENEAYRVLLDTPPSATTTGMWVKSDYSVGPFTPEYLRDNWDAHASEWAGEWVWDTYERNGSANANDGTGAMSMRMIAMDRWEHTGTDEVTSTTPDPSVPSSYTGNLDGGDDGYGDNLSFSVPSAINYVVRADGMLVAPSNIRIANMSAYPVRVSSVTVTATSPFSLVVDAQAGATSDAVSVDISVTGDVLHAYQYANKAAPPNPARWNIGAADTATDELAISSSGHAANLTADITSRTNFASIRWYLTPGIAS